MKKLFYLLVVLAIACTACGKKDKGDAFEQPGFTADFAANFTPDNTLTADSAFQNLDKLTADNAAYLALYYLNASGLDFEKSLEYGQRAVACYDAAVKANPDLTAQTLEACGAALGTPVSASTFEALRNAGAPERAAETIAPVTDTAAVQVDDVPEQTVDEAIQAVENV